MLGKEEAFELFLSFLTLSFAFSLFSKLPLMDVALTVGIAVIAHELAHRAVASVLGARARYRIWIQGLLLILLFSLLSCGNIIFAAPGFVVVEGNVSKRKRALIASAGPMSNLLLSIIYLKSRFRSIAVLGYKINMFLALFNLLPFASFDGNKVYEWSREFWGFLFFLCILTLLLWPAL